MEFKICLKKLFRTPVKTFLFFLLLTVTGALLSLCISLLTTARDTNKKAQEAFTTIAVPNLEKIRYDAIDNSKNLNSLGREEYIKAIESINKLYYKVLDTASESNIGTRDIRNSYLAFSENLIPVILPYNQRKTWNEWDSSYNMVVFELYYQDFRKIRYDKNAKFYHAGLEDITVIIWKINKVLAMHPSYEIIDTVETYTTESEMNIRGLFEQGKRYLMAGHISNFISSQENLGRGSKYTDRINFFREDSFSNLTFDNNMNLVLNQECEGYFSSYIELKGDVNVFLNSDEGANFKRLIENCQLIDQSVNVITTDNINAVPHFNQKKAFIVNGREFTPEDYEQGQNICVVNWQFAALNNLNVGDEIKLSLSNAEYGYFQNNIEKEPIWLMNANPYSMPSSKEQSFKIVGIYQAPKWEISEFMLSPNTIFVPSKSVDHSTIEQDSITSDDTNSKFKQIPTSLYSMVIPNDRLEEFKEELKQKGIDKYFLYYDQGYYAVKSVLKILTQNATIILFVGFFIWLLVLVLFILLYVIKEKKVAGIMLSLGVGTRRTFAHLLISCMLLALPSTILGGVISNALEDKAVKVSYNMAVDQIMGSPFDKSFSVNSDTSYNILNNEENGNKENQNSIITLKSNGFVLIIAFLQFLIILCMSSAFIYFMLRKNPMELVKSKE